MKEEDITIELIEDRLKEITNKLHYNTATYNFTDLNIICEEVFGRLLNYLLGLNLVSFTFDLHDPKYPAVDLIDESHSVVFQVTAIKKDQNRKVEGSIKTFEKIRRNGKLSDIKHLGFLFLDFNVAVDLKKISEYKISDACNIEIYCLKDIVELTKSKAKKSPKVCIDVYQMLTAVYDTGLLNYEDVLTRREHASKNFNFQDFVRIGSSTFYLSAFIPQYYEDATRLAAKLEFVQKGLSDVILTFRARDLVDNYFVTEEMFLDKHTLGFLNSDKMIPMQFGDTVVYIEAFAAYNIYKKFQQLGDLYKQYLDKVLGVTGYQRYQRRLDQYVIKIMTKEERDKFLDFAESHEVWETDDRSKNIFYYRRDDYVLMQANDSVPASITYASLFIKGDEYSSGKFYLIWQPGSQKLDKKGRLIKSESGWRANDTLYWLEENIFKNHR